MTANTTMKITGTITTIDTSDRLPLGGDDVAVGMKGKTITVQDICTVCRCSFRCCDALGTGGDFENLQLSSSLPPMTLQTCIIAALAFNSVVRVQFTGGCGQNLPHPAPNSHALPHKSFV